MEPSQARVLVTGAGRGIGRAVARTLAGQGAKVALVARTASEIEALAEEINRAGRTALAVPCDVREKGACDDAVRRTVEAFGGLNVLVNNAGVGAHASVAETDDETWARILDTNLTGVFRMTRAALPHLTRGGGHIFMVSSLAGQNAIAGMAAYCASKAALDHFTACLMLEVRHQGVKVTTLAPGSVDTGFATDRGRPQGQGDWMLQPADIAGALLDLLRTRDDAHLSRVEMRPLRPKRA
jgi:3-oxoacyl-[acyl-carrier protein] reductase